ncbi:hypothetical protein LUZ61_011939 [Rhynchospora tenuis]|uniref:Uncharacterized protein n=1 Tax=Rhynchospora tenuis TaxID=198213 RepID=A0AAD6F0T6_9POAL|nr:hypothetical protein LUZ61_011939 [Rhynchospora tenuis]
MQNSSSTECSDGGARPDTGTGEQYLNPRLNPMFIRLREILLSADTSDGWEKTWEEGNIPWDLGKPTPIVIHLGYDVVALAGPERYVVGLDMSGTAIKKAKELAASSPNRECFSFLNEDFFNWNPSELFDLMFDYTFFCALEPALRSDWAKKVGEILKPEGELITLIWVIDQNGGPPFKNNVSEYVIFALRYEEVLFPLGFKQIYIEDNELAVKPRKKERNYVIVSRFMQLGISAQVFFH